MTEVAGTNMDYKALKELAGFDQEKFDIFYEQL